MKRIEELFISQWPWKMYHKDMIYHKDCRDSKVLYVEAQNLDGITYIDCNEEQIPHERGFANAAIISAAPELYEALREAILAECIGCRYCGLHPKYECYNHDCRQAPAKWRSALAKAAGEEVRDDS